MAKTALITGASGFLGRQVVKAFQRAGYKTVGTALTRVESPAILKVDLCNKDEVIKLITKVKPDVVVHCAAARFPDKVDNDPEGARTLNVTATASLAQACAAHDALLIYISTDYVFSGRPGEAPYTSSTKPAPSNVYGQTKADGEQAVLATMSPGLGVALRVPVLYGSTTRGNSESAVNTLVDAVWKAQDMQVMMDDWAIRYPTNTEDVGRVCADIAGKYLEEDNSKALPQVLQFSSEDKMTKYQICELLAEVLGIGMGKMQANKQGNDPRASVQRPYDCHLSTNELAQLGIYTNTQDFRAWWRRELGAYRK